MIYLDHNATTPLDPQVRAEMDDCLDRAFGNPSSLHALGQQARRLLDLARRRTARLIGANPEEIVFTSGGTEAANLAILGGVAALGDQRPQVITTAIEHQAVLNACRHLEQHGRPVAWLPVDGNGQVDLAPAVAAASSATGLVSVMLANNETGVVQPIAELAAAIRGRGAWLHVDAVQAVGKLPVEVKRLGLDLLSFSGHKLYGPKGIGALWLRPGVRPAPLLFGGHQERSLRPGTENVAAIVGFGKACELAAARLAEDAARLASLRDTFETKLTARLDGCRVNGAGAPRLPNTSNIGFAGIDADLLAINLDLLEVAVGTGAACSTAEQAPSHVLLAMGQSPADARSAIRFSLGRNNTEAELAATVDRVCQAVASLRETR